MLWIPNTACVVREKIDEYVYGVKAPEIGTYGKFKCIIKS